jgi:hypothetical protein
MPRRKRRFERWLQRHPRTTLGIGIAALGATVVWEIFRIAAARHTVLNGWAAGLVVGLAASVAMITVLVTIYRLIQGAPRRHGGLAFLVTVLIGASPAVVAFVFTAPQPGPESAAPYIVTTAASVAGMAYAAMFFVLYFVLLMRALSKVMRSPPAAVADTDRELLTALVGPCETGWDVSWTGEGRTPARLTAPTLTEVTDQAAAAAVQRYLRHPGEAAKADFQIVLFPRSYTEGPIFEINGRPGAFTATDRLSGRTLNGSTLETLLQAAETADDLQAGEYMFHWNRPVTALPGTSGAGLEAAS